MTIKAVVAAGALALLGPLSACSDDTDDPLADSAIADSTLADSAWDTGVDAAVADGTPPADAKGPVKYSGNLAALVYSGRINWGPSKPGADKMGTFLNFEPMFEPPFGTLIKPDFIDKPNPPHCIGYKWSETKKTYPNKTTGDAGKISITGHKVVKYVDANNPATPKDLPATLQCTRKQLGTTGRYAYDCGLPERTMLVNGSWLEDTTKLSFSVAGGKDIAAFSEKDVAAAPLVKPSSTFDMNQVDPKSIKAQWQPVSATMVGVVITTHLKDNSDIFQIRCSQLGAVGSVTVPSAALAMIPKPTQVANPLIISTVMVAMNPTAFPSKAMPWGTSIVAVGRGTIGMSCRMPDGTQCK